jgi:rsbT antagonist protein RsbS
MIRQEEIPVLKIGDFLITSIQVSLHDKLALAFQENVLRRIDQTNAKGLIIDITAVDVVDSFITRILVETAAMAGLMGAKTVLVGLQPEVAITLVEFGMELKGIYPSLDLEKGLALLQQVVNGAGQKELAG